MTPPRGRVVLVGFLRRRASASAKPGAHWLEAPDENVELVEAASASVDSSEIKAAEVEVPRRIIVFAILGFALVGASPPSQQPGASTPTTQSDVYQSTSEGLRSLIDHILQAAKLMNTTKEQELIHTLIVPEDSTWFVDVYGPGFGASLAAAYQRLRPSLEKEIKTVYEGNVQRGWTSPKILRYTDPESVNAPVDHFLNSMNQIVPLYTTAFQGNGPSFFMSLKPGDNGKQGAGDLDGYFIYDRGGFRFILMEILMKLPSARFASIST